MRRLRSRLSIIGPLLLFAALVASCAGSSKHADSVYVLTWRGEVNQVMERYIDRGINDAESANAPAVVIRLDTPGGLDSAMRAIVQRIEASRVPVIVYVAPAGGRAASAGTFITMAANVAAMAPNTSIGAATPINSNGEDIPGALGRKVTNDAVSYIRGIAQLRDRNADWAESAVRDAVSADATSAVTQNVVDYIASGTDDLLAQADGRQAQVATDAGSVQTVTIHTAGLPTFNEGTNVFEDLLSVIADPNIAYVLLLAGGMLVLSELFHPSLVAGVIGSILLVLAYFSLAALPTNWVAVALIGLGFVLLTAEVFVSGFGVLGLGGIVSLAFGGIFLVGSSGNGAEVSRWLIIGLLAVVGLFFFVVVGALLRVRRASRRSPVQSLIGSRGMVRKALDPTGVVWVGGERWEAIADEGPIEEEASVIIVAKEGLRLHVRRDPASVKLLPPVQVPQHGP
jgi:membrane-bound serine protease (ClpP class)